jgi:spore coat polysaccharide biosynthesis predicted glycosyltransferase SpsG
MFGGSDPFNITIPLLLALDELNNDSAGTVFPPIKVLTGAAYPRLQELLHTLSNLTLDVEHIHDCHKVSSILNDSQLVISAAGGTQFELLACHTPAILVIVAENQRPATLEAQSQGWCCVVDNDIEAVLQISCLARSLCDTPNILINMHRNAKAYSDTKGAERIINMMRL